MKPKSWRDLIESCRAYYVNHPGGGSLHIVLDDGNIQKEHVKWCLERAQAHGDEEGERLAKLLLEASETQRQKLWENYSSYCSNCAAL